jgi:hypothetical protein
VALPPLFDEKRNTTVMLLEKMRVATQIENFRRIPELRAFVEAVISGAPERFEALDRRIDDCWRFGGYLGGKLRKLEADAAPRSSIAELEQRSRKNLKERKDMMSERQTLCELLYPPSVSP